MPVVPSPRALIDLADVKGYLPNVLDGDTSYDDVLQDLINAESREIHRDAGREFVTAGAGPRLFDVDDEIAYNEQLEICDATSVTLVQLLNPDGTLIYAAAAGSWVALPRNREEWEPIRRLWFRCDLNTSVTLYAGMVVRVTAEWGFPEVPEDVKHACKVFVARDFLKDLARHSRSARSLSNDEQAALGRDLRKALDTIGWYRRGRGGRTVQMKATP